MEGPPDEERINYLIENHRPAHLVVCALNMGDGQPIKANLMVLVGTPEEIDVEIKDDPLGRVENAVRTSFGQGILAYRLFPLRQALRVKDQLAELEFTLSNPQDIFDL